MLEGEPERARVALEAVLDRGSDNPTLLGAARLLLELRPALKPALAARALVVIAERESDDAVRVSTANELLELGGRSRLDARTETTAWRALLLTAGRRSLGTPRGAV